MQEDKPTLEFEFEVEETVNEESSQRHLIAHGALFDSDDEKDPSHWTGISSNRESEEEDSAESGEEKVKVENEKAGFKFFEKMRPKVHFPPKPRVGFGQSQRRSNRAIMLRLESEDDDSDADLEYDSAASPSKKLARSNSMPIHSLGLDAEEMIDFDIVKRRSRLKASKKLDKPSVEKGRMWFIRVLFFPLFLGWWANKLEKKWLVVSFVLYLSQFFALYTYFTETCEFSDVTKFEVTWCIALLLLVAFLLGHCAAVSSAVNKTLKMEMLSWDNSSPRSKPRDVNKTSKRRFPIENYLKRHPSSRSSASGNDSESQSGLADKEEGKKPSEVDLGLIRHQHLKREKSNHSNSTRSLRYDDDDSESSDEDAYSDESYEQTMSEASSSKQTGNLLPSGRNRPKSSPPSSSRRGWPSINVLSQQGAVQYRPDQVQPTSPRSSSVRSFLWSQRGVQDCELSVSDVRNAIYKKIDASKPNTSYVFFAEVFALLIGFLPVLFRIIRNSIPVLCWVAVQPSALVYLDTLHLQSVWDVGGACQALYAFENRTVPSSAAHHGQGIAPPLGDNHMFVCFWDDKKSCEQSLLAAVLHGCYDLIRARQSSAFIATSSLITSTYLLAIFFQFVAVAEDAFRRRLLYAKYFSKLTSSRRARKAGLPHFRLNRVNHIRVWLELRSDSREAHNSSYRFGDAAANTLVATNISAVFIVCLRMFSGAWTISRVDDVVLFVTVLCLATYMYRFMHLASRTQKKYDTSKILYTEQLNLYIKIFSNPSNKEELVACNNMLKIAVKLTDEKSSSGKKDKGQVLLLNPIIYNLLRVTILSALGTMSSDLLGFKIRLWKL